MSGENYTRWRPSLSDDEDEDYDDAAKGSGNTGTTTQKRGRRGHRSGEVTIVTSPPKDGHLTVGARFRLLCIMVLVCLVFLVSGFVFGFVVAFLRQKDFALNADRPAGRKLFPDHLISHPEYHSQTFLWHLQPHHIREYLREVNETPKNLLPDFVENVWKTQGLNITTSAFTLTLSKPDRNNPNSFTVEYKDGHKLMLNPVNQNLSSQPFLAYSASGSVSAPVVYGHYGRREDLTLLQARKVNFKGSILLLRHGKLPAATKVHNAEQAGAAGVVIYPDPADLKWTSEAKQEYPKGSGLPKDGVVWDTLAMNPGDPATPFLPDIDDVYRLSRKLQRLPKIPADTISADAAAHLMSLMSGGPKAPDKWQGGLDLVYHLGGSWKPQENVVNVTLKVNNIIYTEVKRNVHASLPALDNSKVVMIGCHYDSLYEEPGAGLAVLLAMSKALKEVYEYTGTRRKIIFSAWAAGDYGMLGSTEFTDLYSSWVERSAMAYLSVDEVLQGTGMMRVMASPLLREAIREAATHVPWPLEEALTVRDGWRRADPLGERDVHFSSPGSGSDFVSFTSQHGVPSAHFMVVGKDWRTTYPLRHTQYDTLKAYTEILDPDYEWTHMIASLVITVALVLSESELPPVIFTELSGELYNGWQRFLDLHTSSLNQSGYDFDGILGAIENELEILNGRLTDLNSWYNDELSHLGEDPSFHFWSVEEKVQRFLSLERSLLGPRGVGRTFATHLMVGPDPEDPERAIHYPHASVAITNALLQKTGWENVHQELSYILAALRSFEDLFPSDSL